MEWSAVFLPASAATHTLSDKHTHSDTTHTHTHTLTPHHTSHINNARTHTHTHTHAVRVAGVAPIQQHADVAPVPAEAHVGHERMLRMLVEECAKGEDSTISVDPEGSMLVQSEVDPT